MNQQKQFLKPGTDTTTGKPFQVYIPSKRRNISPEGEALMMDPYLEKRVLSGELVKGEPITEKASPAKSTKSNNQPTTGGEK